MERALRTALITAVPELTNSIYPTNAPETATRPYLVYTRISTDKVKTLEGYTDKESLSFLFSIMATEYSAMKSLTDKVEAFLIALPKTTIGTFYIEDLEINNISETYEFELGVNRGIIDFTIYY